jgi:hypothetical protein
MAAVPFLGGRKANGTPYPILTRPAVEDHQRNQDLTVGATAATENELRRG